MAKTIAIIGAGPIGLEAALAARLRGYRVHVYERGGIADSVRRWGHIRMFSPFAMNASEAGVSLVRKAGRQIPAPDALLTGSEYVEAYLAPLAESLDVQTRTQVKALAREGAGKRDKIGEPTRADTPFRLLVEHEGIERYDDADLVFDCSGTFLNPNPLGDAGLPALGEAGAQAAIGYDPSAIANLDPLAGKRVLVAGGGHSAANAIVALADLQRRHPQTTVTWVVKKPGAEPLRRVPQDPLPERDRIVAAANAAVISGAVTLRDGATIHSLVPTDHGIEVTLNPALPGQPLVADRILGLTGFRPDTALSRELQVQNCWATEGTYPLAASLLGEAGGDCLTVASFGAETLRHPEPGYFVLGMKSYGRTPDFLIRTGLEQVASLLDWLDAGGGQ
ncbi:MAG: NAD(P)-binding domain-containing protein [Verrucomicrobiae bacterium]|nr:NAD(P)-binding domain-containing protein [Verrucomicrobiae bacterium]